MKLKPNDFRKLVVASFLAVPALSSLISTIHIITFFGLGNMTWMAIILALAFEIGSIASLMTLAVLDKINRFAVWFIFVVLVAMQMLGNVYYTYDYISQAMASNPQWIDSFIDLVEMMTMQKLEQRTTKFILSLLIGLPIPIISLAFLKSVSDYLKPESNEQKVEKFEETKDNTDVKTEDIVETIAEVEIAKEEVIEEIEESVIEEIAEQSETQSTEIETEYTETIKEDVVEPIEELEVKGIDETISETFEDKTEIIEETETSISESTEQIDEEQIIEEEKSEDIYEEEPHESFFDDTTIEEQHDDFIDEEDIDEKKSQ